jgi:hypothetical protein
LHDDEVHIKRKGHPAAPRHSQRHMWITFIMAFNHRKSLQTWILQANSYGWHDGDRHHVQGLLVILEADYKAVTPDFKSKSNAHSMCAQESCLHTYHPENRYRITNI